MTRHLKKFPNLSLETLKLFSKLFTTTARGFLVTSHRKCASFLHRSISSSFVMAKPNVIFVLGGPGAGKGTQCEKIVEKFGFKHLSAGDLLREERQRKGSQYGEEIENHIRNGTIVPVEITCSLLERAMNQSDKENFLIDGFPRNQDNYEGWTRVMSDKVTVKQVFFFDCSDKVCVDRCLNRGKTSGRSDDNIESLTKRIETYKGSTMPVIERYEKMSLLTKFNAENTADKVFEDVKKALIDLGFPTS